MMRLDKQQSVLYGKLADYPNNKVPFRIKIHFPENVPSWEVCPGESVIPFWFLDGRV